MARESFAGVALVMALLLIIAIGFGLLADDEPECRTGAPHSGKGYVYESSLPECPTDD